MTIIKSNKSAKPLSEGIKDFTINALRQELQDKTDLIEIYKVALAEEGQNHLNTKIGVKGHLADLVTIIDNGDVKRARTIMTHIIAAL